MDYTRYVNHQDKPKSNLVFMGPSKSTGYHLHACREILPGEELFFFYGKHLSLELENDGNDAAADSLIRISQQPRKDQRKQRKRKR